MAISVGSVSVDVVPNASKFWSTFKTQTETKASKIGKELGKIVGTAAAGEISKSIPEGMAKGAKAAKAQGAEAGEDYGGKFGTAARARITAALKALPNVDIDADVTEAQLEIAVLRAELVALGEHEIGIDVSPEDFLAELARIKAELARFSATSTDKDLKFNTAEATAELTAFETLADKHDVIKKRIEVENAKVEAAKAAEDFGGTFSRTVRAHIAAALQSLPKADIDADSSEADRKLAILRGKLEELGDKTIGLDIDEAVALAEIARIRRALFELGTEHPEIRVAVAALEASTSLAAIGAAAEAVDGKKVEIKVDVDSGGALGALAAIDGASSLSMSRTQLLIGAIALLGPTLVPIAAAATGALAAIATGALAGALGLGVLALAFGGIAKTVKALRDQRAAAGDDAARAAKQDLTSSSAVTSAQEQVKSAVESVANARSAAAEGALRAADAVANAERNVAQVRASTTEGAVRAYHAVSEAIQSLSQAQADAKRVEQSLTKARVDAKQAMEDLAAQVIGGAFNQRQAVIDLQRAKESLAKTLADPTATALERQQAQLTFEEAQRHIVDLGVSQKRLVEQKRASDKAGIGGSKEVTTAVKNIGDAQEKVRKAESQLGVARRAQANQVRHGMVDIANAERKVEEARRAQGIQARQGAASIAAAQRQVVSAQRAVTKATTDTGTVGSASMRALKKAIVDQSPAAIAFAKYIDGLVPKFQALKAAAQSGVLPGVKDAIATLMPMLPGLIGFVGRLSATIGDLFRSASKAFTSPFWRSFFSWIDKMAGPTLVSMSKTVGNLATGFAGLLMAFSPVSQQVGDGLLHMSERFAAFGATAGSGSGFQQFLAYVKEQGPIVVDTFVQFVKAVVHLAEAFAPIGGVVLSVIRNVSVAIQGIPIDVLTAMVVGIYAIITAMKLWGIQQTIAGRLQKTHAGAVGGYAKALDTYAQSTYRGTYQTGRFSGALRGLQGAGAVAKRALGGFMGFLGGPWGIAIAIATAGIVYFFSQQAEQKAKVADLADSLGQLSEAYKTSGKDSGEALKSTVDQNKGLQDLIIGASQYGISVGQISGALQGNVSDADNLNRAYNEQIGALSRLATHGSDHQTWTMKDVELTGGLTGAIRLSADALNDKVDALTTERDAMKVAIENRIKARTATDLLTGAEKRNADGSPTTIETQIAVATAMQVLSDKTATAEQKMNALRTAEDLLAGNKKTQIEATDAYAAAQLRLTDGIKANGTALGNNTDKGIANRENVKRLITESVNMYNADIAAGVGVNEATRRHDARTEALKREFSRTKAAKEELDKLLAGYDRIPTKLETYLATKGLDKVNLDLRDLKVIQTALAKNITTGQAFDELKKADRNFGAGRGGQRKPMATGGSIYGPGTKTSDSVPIWASRGEFMQPAHAVDYYGADAMEAIRKKEIPRDALRLARGGLIAPFPVDVTKTKMPFTAAQLRAMYAIDAGGGTGGGNGPAGTWKTHGTWPENTRGHQPPWYPHVAAAAKFIKEKWPTVRPGSYVNDGTSDHFPKAIDAMTSVFNPVGKKAGDEMANWFGANPDKFGTKYIIWNKRFTQGQGWGPYTGTSNPHTDHVHLSFMSGKGTGGAKALPGGSVGADGKATGGGVARWSSTVLRALKELGQSPSNLGAVLRRIDFESSGNPNAINRTDSNARAGHPSQGLMQTIPTTFAAHAGKYRPLGITNPLANIYAGLHYAIGRYGSINAIDPLVRPRGYDSGGYLPPGLSMAWNGTGKPEAVITDSQLQAMKSGRDGGMTLRVVVDDGVVPGLVRVEVDQAFGSLADAHVYGTV